MRGHSNSDSRQRPSRESSKGRRSLGNHVDRLIDQIEDAVSLNSLLWRDLLRVLVTHPRPPIGLYEVHKCLRAASRRLRYDEKFVDQIRQAVTAAAHADGATDLLAPICLVLTACAGAMSARPHMSMVAARQIIQGAELLPPLSLPFETSSDYRSYSAISKADATRTVEKVVQHAVNALLRVRERADARQAFTSWNASELLAGMEALWLAYTYCKIGTANAGKLSAKELQADWQQCGAPLWRQLDQACRLVHSITSREPYVDKTAEACRLALALESEAPKLASAGTATLFAPSFEGLTHIVCRMAIPESSDKHDKEEIARHRVLETPLPVAPMPSLHSMESAKAGLLAEFPWAASAIDVIFDDLLGRINLGSCELTLPPTLLVGLPGAGKSRFARRIAEILDLVRLDVAMAGTSDTKIIGGTSRGWASGRPSDLATLLARRQTASALVLLDEIDKAIDAHRDGGGICAYLLALLEPETASRHYDCFLKTECDLSKVSWLCTANVLSTIPKPLQSRLRILVVPQPKTQHFSLVGRGVIAELEQRWRLPEGTLPAVDDLDIDWACLTSARQVRVATEASIGHWARSMVKH